jgi:hypothetical protein
LELQWRDGCPVEQPVLDSRSSDSDAAGDASSPAGEKSKEGEPVEEWWKLWREGESGGCAAAAAANGYPQQFIDDLSSVNAKVAPPRAGPNYQTSTEADETADELWRFWREGHGSSAPQVVCTCSLNPLALTHRIRTKNGSKIFS